MSLSSPVFDRKIGMAPIQKISQSSSFPRTAALAAPGFVHKSRPALPKEFETSPWEGLGLEDLDLLSALGLGDNSSKADLSLP